MSSSGNPKGAGDLAGAVSSNNKMEDSNGRGAAEDAEDDVASASDHQQQITTNEDRSAQPALHLTSDEVNYLIYRYVSNPLHSPKNM